MADGLATLRAITHSVAGDRPTFGDRRGFEKFAAFVNAHAPNQVQQAENCVHPSVLY
jgi:hypothetical protein